MLTRKRNRRRTFVSCTPTFATLAAITLMFASLLGAQDTGPARHVAHPWDPNSPLAPPLVPGPRLALPLSSTTWTPLGPAPISNGQRPGGGPVSGRLAGVAAHPTDPNTIYVAAAGGGVWRTTDGGTNWTPLTDAQSTLSMGAIAIAPSNPLVLYAGTGEANFSGDSNFGRGVLVSTDGGATWTLRNNGGSFDRKTISEIAIDPTNSSIAYVAMAGGGVNGLGGNTGVWKTIDGGVTWTNTTSGITSIQPWTSVRINPTNPSVLYAAVGSTGGSAQNGVYMTTNGGVSWSLLSGGPTGTVAGRIVVAVAPSNSQVIYVSATGTGVAGSTSSGSLYRFMRSDDGGSTFTNLTGTTPNYLGGQGWYDTTLIVDPTDSAIVYAGGAAGLNSIIRSTTSGASWVDINTGPSGGPHVDHHAAAFDASARYLDGDDGGIYRLDNISPVTWTQLNGNLSTIQFQSIGLHPTDINIALGGSQDNGTSRYTGSLSWTLVEGGDGGTVKFSRTNPLRVYHDAPVGSFGSSAFFRRSDNGGTTWASKVSGITDNTAVLQNFYAPFVVDPGNGDRVLFGARHLWETTNGGDSWTAVGAAFTNNVDAIGLSPSDPNTIYASAAGSTFVTNNHGTTWTPHNLPVSGTVNDIEVDPANSLTAYAVVRIFTGGGNVFRTIDGGVSWTNISGDLPNLPVWSLQVDPTAAGGLYIGTDDGVYKTTNTGASWSRFGLGFPNAQVFEIELNSTLGVLGAATHGRGAWEILTNAPVQLAITKSHSGNFSPGQVGATYTVTVSNVGTAPTSGTVTVTDAPPTGLTITGLSGTGWICTLGTLSCQRSDALTAGGSYPPITVTVNVASNAPTSVTNSATVSGGGDPSPHTANDPTTVTPLPDLTITKTHSGNFTQGQIGATYTLVVSNIGGAPTSGTVTVNDTLPTGFTATGFAGSGWTCTLSPLSCQRADALGSAGSYPSITLAVNVASDAPSSATNTATVSGGGDVTSGNNTANDLTVINPAALALRFIPVTPCRIMDTRTGSGFSGAFGPPFMSGNTTRTVPVPLSSCGIPSTAKAYSLNATVMPQGTLDFLTLWPTGAAQPFVSTLNALDGQITANAAIVPGGTGGSINAFVTNDTDLILDINGYFLDTTDPRALQFYPVTPCRVVDTRNPAGIFGGPILIGGTTRSFPIASSDCGIPATAQAFAFNATVVPSGSLGFLTLWPTGVAQPVVSTLNALDGQITANMAIVPAGTAGAINAFVTDDTHLVLDITGYFAPPASGGLQFYTLTPCRVADTRDPVGTFGGPIMTGGTSRSFPVPSSACGVPATSQAYSMNATVVPSGPLGFLTVWPTGFPQPSVSTLNSSDGQITANALIVPGGTGGGVSTFVTDTTHLIFDISGYFAP
jgi:uncharacterized repeat protein (TIGR01451 family)